MRIPRSWPVVLFSLLLPLVALAADPPARVARLNLIEGTVSFAPEGSEAWSDALLNRPLTDGDRLWVERGSRAELHIGSTALRLDGGSALEILELGDEDLRLKLTAGSLALRVRDYPEDEYIEIDTPNLGFTVRTPGEYRFDVEARGEATTVTLRNGSGTIYDDDQNGPEQRVQSGQRLRYAGDDLRLVESATVGPRDDFDRWTAQRDAREEALRNRYVSREMTGYEDLDAHGEWQTVEGYGTVWFPRVAVGWAPYHDGRWVWVAPWGWTWVDAAPWGFAPFHYGRWAYHRARWCWVPGPVVRRPVYAPALVAFVGGSSGGVSWSVSLASGPGVAWFPLGPGEPYRPAYSHHPRYLERINLAPALRPHDGVYVNQRLPHAIAAMPERDFRQGNPLRPGRMPQLRDADAVRLPVREAPPWRPQREADARERARAEPPEQALRRPAIGERTRPPRLAEGEPGPRRGAFPPAPVQAAPGEMPRGEARPPRMRDEGPRSVEPTRPWPGPRELREPREGRGFRPPPNEVRPPAEGFKRAPEMRIPEMRRPEPAPAAPPEVAPSPMRKPAPPPPEMRPPEARQPEKRGPEMRIPESRRPDGGEHERQRGGGPREERGRER